MTVPTCVPISYKRNSVKLADNQYTPTLLSVKPTMNIGVTPYGPALRTWIIVAGGMLVTTTETATACASMMVKRMETTHKRPSNFARKKLQGGHSKIVCNLTI
jgi:hypothetical protein